MCAHDAINASFIIYHSKKFLSHLPTPSHAPLAYIVHTYVIAKVNDSLTTILLFSLIAFVVVIDSKDLIFDLWMSVMKNH